MMSRRALATLALWPLAPRADEPEALLARIRSHLADAPVLRGEFEQRKTLKGFKHPLVSRGDYVVAKARGVVWRTQEPFASTLVLTRERLLARQPDGSVANRLDTAQEPGLRAVNEMLFALIAADLSALAPRFRIDGEAHGTGWKVVLVPRDATLAQWIKRIELDGDRQVNEVRITEAGGDTSQIRFSRQQTGSALTRDEEARFE
jgi:hypothetical protein